jgi:predicted pyridoxine 5'-phosphate oxidase superfamily flavin-nucleotide-binding protein
LIYLLVMVALAAAGIARLWLQQRRQRARTFTVTEFRSGLEKMSESEFVGKPAVTRAPAARRTVGPTQPLDPARRAAAKRRLEERRQERVRAAR